MHAYIHTLIYTCQYAYIYTHTYTYLSIIIRKKMNESSIYFLGDSGGVFKSSPFWGVCTSLGVTAEKSLLTHKSSLQIENESPLWASSGWHTTTLLLKKSLSKLRHYSPKLRQSLSTLQFDVIGIEHSHLPFIAYTGALILYNIDRGWDGWMVSPTWWTWVWASSGSWWWTGKPGMLQSMGSQRVRHDWATELIIL